MFLGTRNTNTVVTANKDHPFCFISPQEWSHEVGTTVIKPPPPPIPPTPPPPGIKRFLKKIMGFEIYKSDIK